MLLFETKVISENSLYEYLDEISILTQNKPEKIKAFTAILESTYFLTVAIEKYRQQILSERIKPSVTLNDIMITYKNRDDKKLQKQLSDLFLHSISQTEVNLLMNQLNQNRITLEILYNEHIKYPKRKFFRIISQF